ncbi:MAG: Xaa-Pro peptidase family protein [Patescibacteria group bacterium]|jgi:Xaa-Pro aminopeptidase
MVAQSTITNRLQKLRRLLKKKRLGAFLTTDPTTRYYLTGFHGTAGTVLVTSAGAHLYTDFRYTERALSEVPDCITVTEVNAQAKELITRELRQNNVKRFGIEDKAMTLANFEQAKKVYGPFTLVPVGNMVEVMRSIKDEEELVFLRAAINATDNVFYQVVRWLRHAKKVKRLPTEQAVSDYIRDVVHAFPHHELAFPSIVASGPHAARPHHEPTTRRLRLHETVIIDLGVKMHGYHADMSRTLFLGKPSSALTHMFTTTLTAQGKAFRYIQKGGRSARMADQTARDYINKYYPGSFGHSLGHGVGLEIHEAPTLSVISKDQLKPDMVFSIEPGIYLPGVGGIRIEDLAQLTSSCCRFLSTSPKSLNESIL